VVCRHGNVDIALIIMSVFARVDITDENRRTPIDKANLFGNKELVSHMSQLLDVSNYTPSSNTATNVRSTNVVTQATADVIVSDVSVVASDVRSTVQPRAHRSNKQQERQSVTVVASNCKWF
jgi:hypothetical protein